MLRVRLASLAAGGVALDNEVQPGEPCFEDLGFSLNGPVRLKGRLAPSAHGEYFLHGKLEASGVGECRRCLAEVSFEIQQDLDILFAGSDESEDPSVYPIPEKVSELYLGDMLREELILATPTLLTCREDCRGLCARCGADLNDGPCECGPEVDPRWARLQELKKD